MDDAAKRQALVQQFEPGRDLDRTHEIYHDDAVVEFPQSGERFVGKENFLTWRKQYPAKVDYRIRRITGHGELWVAEILVSYNGSPPMLGLGVFQFRGDKIARRGRAARRFWAGRSPGCVTAGTAWRRVRGNGGAAAARAVRPQR